MENKKLFFRIGIDYIPDWAMDKISNNDIILKSPTNGENSPFKNMNDTYCEIKTNNGVVVCDFGDYIILDLDGKCYSCKPDIFEKTYEAV